MLEQGEGDAPQDSGREFFAPRKGERARRRIGGRVTWPRLVVRLAFMAVFLIAADRVAATVLAPDTAFQHAYRLPRTLPTASIGRFADSIHAASLAEKNHPIVVFLGASPTWGHRISDSRNTFPAAFETAAKRGGWPNTTYNLACNGQFVSDEYSIARRVAPDADVVFVQLTYHTFNAKAREGQAIRYPELPAMLGTGVLPADAAALGVRPSMGNAVSSRTSRMLSRYWLVWGERDALDGALFGTKPQMIFAPKQKAAETSLTVLPDDAAQDGFVKFDKLDPERQFVVISRYAQSSSFTIPPDDSELVFLRKLTHLLRSQDKKAVFFLAPLNRTLIDDYELIDPKQYGKNSDAIRSVVEESGFPFIDFNEGSPPISADLFADISHTTDKGGRKVGSMLFDETRSYLEERP